MALDRDALSDQLPVPDYFQSTPGANGVPPDRRGAVARQRDVPTSREGPRGGCRAGRRPSL